MPRKKTLKYKPVKASVPIGLGWKGNDFTALEQMLEGTGLNPDRMRAFLHQGYASRRSETDDQRKHETVMYLDRWFPLSAELLKIVYPNEYKKYLKWLEENNILIPNRRSPNQNNRTGGKSFIPGEKCTYYRFNPELLSIPDTNLHYRQELITSQKVLKSINTLNERIRENLKLKLKQLPLEPIHEELLQMLGQVRSDVGGADQFITKVKSGEIKVKPTKTGKLRPYSDYLEMMATFNDGQANTGIVDLFGERFYTPVSRLWKRLRKFIFFIDNPTQRLVELDISNSQPYFSSVCLQPEIMEELLPEFSHCVRLLRSYCNHPNFLLYQDLNREGKIYEYWMTLRNMDRDTAKLDFIANVMYSRVKPRKPETVTARKIFKQHFPIVDHLFNFIKTLSDYELPFITGAYINEHGDYQGRKSNFKNLSCAMQRAESRLFLGRICPALIQNGIPRFLTVHDSILVEPAYANKAKIIMEGEFVKLGVKPPVIKAKQL